MVRKLQVFLVLGLVLFLFGCATATITGPRTIWGKVMDEEGSPVANTPLILMGRDLAVPIFPPALELKELKRREVRTVTDEKGLYRFDFNGEDLGNNFLLFFYDREGFDSIQYQKPEPMDITRRLKEERELQINQVLMFTKDWPEIQRLIKEYGPETEKGKILRQFGLPERKERFKSLDVESETWWYYTKGVAYKFVDGKLKSTYEFAPLKEVPKEPIKEPLR